MRKTGDILKKLIHIDESGCWLWDGEVSKTTGYGLKQFGGRSELAHRWVYTLFNGPVPVNRVINHLCSVRHCVNPQHMEVTTQAGNCRHGKGSKLTEAQVREIKAILPTLKWGERGPLANRYGVSPQLITDIKLGRAWADI